MNIINGKQETAVNRVGGIAYNELLEIAKSTILNDDRISLDTHNNGSDFFEISVFQVNEFMQRAYELGFKNGEMNSDCIEMKYFLNSDFEIVIKCEKSSDIPQLLGFKNMDEMTVNNGGEYSYSSEITKQTYYDHESYDKI